MKRWTIALVAALLAVQAMAQPASPEDQLTLYRYELNDVRLLLDLSREVVASDRVIRRATVFDPVTATSSANQRVTIVSGKIAAVTVDDESPVGPDEIDASGFVLIPGLADSHVHQLTGVRQILLNLAAGVTTVRDMDGFDWLLKWREQSRQDDWIAQNMVVTGHILNAFPMGMYMTVVETPEAARAAVRTQTEAGYDFIKIHNRLAPEVFDAVLGEAKRLQIEVVGHIPHGISVAHAIGSGMTVLEHFKGYLLDSTLRMSDEDFVTPTRGADVWNDPTFYTIRQYWRGPEGEAWSSSEEAKYVPDFLEEQWLAVDDPVLDVQKEINETKRAILARLVPVTDRFLAGSDSGGGYPFMVGGFALHDEMRLLREAGLPPADVMRAATINAALATGRGDEFGTIEAGKRADIAFLTKDPMHGFGFADVAAVMVRGRWLSPDRRAALLTQLRDSASAAVPALDAAGAARLVADARALLREGYVFPTHHLDEMAAALDDLGFTEAATSIRLLGGTPAG